MAVTFFLSSSFLLLSQSGYSTLWILCNYRIFFLLLFTFQFHVHFSPEKRRDNENNDSPASKHTTSTQVFLPFNSLFSTKKIRNRLQMKYQMYTMMLDYWCESYGHIQFILRAKRKELFLSSKKRKSKNSSTQSHSCQSECNIFTEKRSSWLKEISIMC